MSITVAISRVSPHRWWPLATLSLAGCAAWPGAGLSDEPSGAPAKEWVWAVTADHQLIQFNAGQPQKVLQRRPVSGLLSDDAVIGIDFRVARGVLYAVSQRGRVYTLNTATGAATPVSASLPAVAPKDGPFGVDFNPAADRLRVVSAGGQNLRLHPDTGAVVDFDPKTPGLQHDPDLAYAPGDPAAGRKPTVAAAAYTYNKRDEKLTTNYAIDMALGALVRQGSVEGVAPVVSPNLGQLFTVGSLGLGPLSEVSLDIADLNNKALAALRTRNEKRTRLYEVDLSNGKARLLGTVADGAALRGMAIEP